MLTQVAPPTHSFTMTPWEIIPLCIVLSVCFLILVFTWPMDEVPLAAEADEPVRRAALPSCPAPFDWSTDETIGSVAPIRQGTRARVRMHPHPYMPGVPGIDHCARQPSPEARIESNHREHRSPH